jgi:hypothetical protein
VKTEAEIFAVTLHVSQHCEAAFLKTLVSLSTPAAKAKEQEGPLAVTFV